jgi:hypothetical protein
MHECLDRAGEEFRFRGWVEPPVVSVVHEVQRSAGRWSDHRHPARQRLLDRLTEGLVEPGVHEYIE